MNDSDVKTMRRRATFERNNAVGIATAALRRMRYRIEEAEKRVRAGHSAFQEAADIAAQCAALTDASGRLHALDQLDDWLWLKEN